MLMCVCRAGAMKFDQNLVYYELLQRKRTFIKTANPATLCILTDCYVLRQRAPVESAPFCRQVCLEDHLTQTDRRVGDAGRCEGRCRAVRRRRRDGCSSGCGSGRQRIDDPERAGHLLHPTELSFSLSVGELDDETGRGALGYDIVSINISDSSSSSNNIGI